MSMDVHLSDCRIVQVQMILSEAGDTTCNVTHDYDSLTLTKEDIDIINYTVMQELLTTLNKPKPVLKPRRVRVRNE